MANILSYIETEGGLATHGSLWALNRARELATELGATLYAVLPCSSPPSYDDDDIIAVLSRHGADKVLLVSHPSLGSPALSATHGSALLDVCRQFPPRLFIFPASAEARDIAPRLAAALRSHYVPDATVTIAHGEASMERVAFRRQYLVRERITEDELSVVLLLQQKGAPRDMGDEEAEVVVLHAESATPARVQLEASRPISSTPQARPDITVGGGAGLEQRTAFEALQRLAAALHSEAVASNTAREQGLTELPALGLDGLAVERDMVLALAISGSEALLAGIAPHTHLVAVNQDPEAPIMRVADTGLVADAGEVLQQLNERLDRDAEGRR